MKTFQRSVKGPSGALGQVRVYGRRPYRVAVLHGGPGGAGELAPVADGLAMQGISAIEPWQTATGVAGQVDELARQITAAAHPPVALIGWSWGAWLAVLLAAERPDLADRLILIGSPAFRAGDGARDISLRDGKLTAAEHAELGVLKARAGLTAQESARFIALSERMDAVEPDAIPVAVSVDFEINRRVWAEALALRQAGLLLERLQAVRCPITLLHGACDPRLARGAIDPVIATHPTAHVQVFPRCGHKPWIEKHAKAAFWAALIDALSEFSPRA